MDVPGGGHITRTLAFTADGNQHPTIHFGASPYGVDMRYIIVGPNGSNTDDACYLLEDQGLFYTRTCSSGGPPERS